MNKELIFEVRRKREFSGLPDSIVERALEICNGDVKESRAFLRKYFGVFLTNKVLKGKGINVLKSHKSSARRDYEKFYSKIFEDEKFSSVVDLGCGVNGFSYEFLPRGVKYFGAEATRQVVENVNEFFKREKVDGEIFCLDLFDISEIKKIVKKAESPRVIFMLQVVDALEGMERDFSKKFLLEVSKVLNEKDLIVISFSTESLEKRKRFLARRKWLVDFMNENFLIKKDFLMSGERVIILKNKK